MRIEELVRSQKFLTGDLLDPYREAVRSQARNHTRRRLKNQAIPLVADARPNETEPIRLYRAKNERQITRSAVDRFTSKVTRIVTGGLTFEGIEGNLKKYVDSKPFYSNGSNYDFIGFLFSIVFPDAIEDPNRIIFAFPYNPLNPDVAPAERPSRGGLAAEDDLAFETKIIIPKYVDDDIFSYEGGVRVFNTKDGIIEEPFYFAADKDAWYTIEPKIVYKDGIRMIQYFLKVWYEWKLGVSPVNLLPGSTSRVEEGKFRESYLMAYYEYADEVIASFSDNQAVRSRFNHPVVEMDPIACTNPSCEKGYIIDPAGKGKTKCPYCIEGAQKAPGVFGVINRPKVVALEGEPQSNRPIIQYHTPDHNTIKSSYDTWVDLLRKGKQEIGLDLLDGTGVESGHAKDLRLGDLRDFLTKIAIGIATCGVQWIAQIDALLNFRTTQRQDIGFRIPATFKEMDAMQLRIQAEEALPEDRFASRMSHYRIKYTSRPEIIAMYELALMYCPTLLLKETEVYERFAAGILTKKHLVRMDNAIPVIRDLIRLGKLDLKKPVDFVDAMELIEAYIVERGLYPPEPTPIIDAS